MRKIFSLKKITISLFIVFAVIQFFRIDKTNPQSDKALDFIAVTNPNAEISTILKTACYDCHSHESQYPWYSNVAPVSWLVKDHIQEGREELNFSLWKNYSGKKRDKKLEECAELIKEGEMPLWSYTMMHSDAKLTATQRTILANWFDGLRAGNTDASKQTEGGGD
jgi:hypothetical protein